MLIDTLRSDLTVALKAGDSIRVDTLRFLISAVKNFEIDAYPPSSNKSLTDEDVLSVIAKQVKTHKESIEMFTKANRQDLIQRESAQLHILEEYLPKQMTNEEILNVVQDIKNNMKNEGQEISFGTLMSEVMKILRGKADGSVVSHIVREEIT